MSTYVMLSAKKVKEAAAIVIANIEFTRRRAKDLRIRELMTPKSFFGFTFEISREEAEMRFADSGSDQFLVNDLLHEEEQTAIQLRDLAVAVLDKDYTDQKIAVSAKDFSVIKPGW